MKNIYLYSIAVALAVGIASATPRLFQIRCANHTWDRDLNSLELALEKYKIDTGDYPRGNSSQISRQLLGENTNKTVYYDGRITDEGFILDPWGRPYRFSYYEDFPIIRSYGKDGQFSDDDKTNR